MRMPLLTRFTRLPTWRAAGTREPTALGVGETAGAGFGRVKQVDLEAVGHRGRKRAAMRVGLFVIHGLVDGLTRFPVDVFFGLPEVLDIHPIEQLHESLAVGRDRLGADRSCDAHERDNGDDERSESAVSEHGCAERRGEKVGS